MPYTSVCFHDNGLHTHDTRGAYTGTLPRRSAHGERDILMVYPQCSAMLSASRSGPHSSTSSHMRIRDGWARLPASCALLATHRSTSRTWRIVTCLIRTRSWGATAHVMRRWARVVRIRFQCPEYLFDDHILERQRVELQKGAGPTRLSLNQRLPPLIPFFQS